MQTTTTEISFTDLPDRPSRGGPDDKHAAHAEPGRAGPTSPGGGGGGEAAAGGAFRSGVAGAVAGAAAETICLVLTIVKKQTRVSYPTRLTPLEQGELRKVTMLKREKTVEIL